MPIIDEAIQVIAREIAESNATQWTITKIVKELNEMNTTSEKKLRERSLELLKELDKDAAIIYERFSKMKVYNSDEKVTGFNRGNIIKSVTKETGLARGIAEKITLEVENSIKDAKIEYLSTSVIRELVNAKLITYGYEEVRHSYARIGEPAYDVKEKIEKFPYFGETTREYNLSLVIPKKARDLHYEGTILIEDTEGYSNRPYSYSIIAKENNTLEKTILENVKELVKSRKYFCLEPNLYGITHELSKFVKNETHAKKAGELLLNALEIAGENFVTSIELFSPSALEKIQSDKIMAAKIGETLIGRTQCVIGVDSKYSLKLINYKGKSFEIINNSEEEYYPLNNDLFSQSQGIDLFVNINLEKIGQDNDIDTFFQKLNETSESIKEAILKKKKLLESKEYLKEFKVNELKTGIGITNLFSVADTLGEEKKIEFANKTYKEITKIFNDELIFGCTNNAIQKFSSTCNKPVKTQQALDFEECLNSKKGCFTGKATNLDEVEELITKKVKQISYLG